MRLESGNSTRVYLSVKRPVLPIRKERFALSCQVISGVSNNETLGFYLVILRRENYVGQFWLRRDQSVSCV